MFPFLIRLAISAGALLFLANISGDAIQVKGWIAAFVTALLIGVLNAFVKPILEFIAGALTLPLSCLTLGLWSLLLSWLLNAAMFKFADALLSGFEVKGFWPAMWGSLVLAIVNSLASSLLGEKKEGRRYER